MTIIAPPRTGQLSKCAAFKAAAEVPELFLVLSTLFPPSYYMEYMLGRHDDFPLVLVYVSIQFNRQGFITPMQILLVWSLLYDSFQGAILSCGGAAGKLRHFQVHIVATGSRRHRGHTVPSIDLSTRGLYLRLSVALVWKNAASFFLFEGSGWASLHIFGNDRFRDNSLIFV